MTLATGNSNPGFKLRQHKVIVSGFTLVELLVVLLIIGLMLGLVTVSFPDNSDRKISYQESRKLVALLKLANQDATFNSRMVGLSIDTNQYQFMVLNNDQEWIPLQDKIFAKRKLPNKLTIELQTSHANSPQVLLSVSGEMTPFIAHVVGQDNTVYYEIRGTFTGNLSLKKSTGAE